MRPIVWQPRAPVKSSLLDKRDSRRKLRALYESERNEINHRRRAAHRPLDMAARVRLHLGRLLEGLAFPNELGRLMDAAFREDSDEAPVGLR